MKNPNPHRGKDYMKVLNAIKKIKNFMQIEPTRRLIDLFGKKPGNSELKVELLQHLFNKAKDYQYYEDEILNIHHARTCGFNKQ